MKKIAFIFTILAGSLAFTNCSSDDDNGGADCFDCNLIITATYCHTDGDDFYTMTVGGQTENVPMDGESWEEIKAAMQQVCSGSGL